MTEPTTNFYCRPPEEHKPGYITIEEMFAQIRKQKELNRVRRQKRAEAAK